MEAGPKSSRFQWHAGEDCTTDGPWIDTPGERHILVEDKRGEKRSIITSYVKRFANGYRALQEFIVGVGMGMKDWAPVASFGGLYFIMAADIRATDYRVLMSQPRNLTDKELLGAMGDPSKPFPLHVIPKDAPPDFASFPGQAESSGWRDYRGNAR